MSNISWKTFTTEKDGVKLEVTWWSHDFTAKYKVGDITLRYGLHIMAMCPKKYSEEWLRNDFEKKGLYASFKEAGEIISNQSVFFEAAKAKFAITKKETLEYYHICKSIADDITVINEDARTIIREYLESLWENCDTPVLYAWKIYVPDSDDFYTKEQEKFEDELRHGHFDFEKIPGKSDHTKCIYFLPNVTKEDSEEMSGHFHNVYSYRAYQEKLSDEERQKELDDFLMSKNLKNEFPLSLSRLSENFFKRYPYRHPEMKMSEIKVYTRNGTNHTGRERWLYRARMYHHPQDWELKDGFRNKYYENWKKEL